MDMTIDVIEYDNRRGLEFAWDNSFSIAVVQRSHGVEIVANRAGLISLARVLLTMAQDSIDLPRPFDIELDESNALEDDSLPLRLIRTD
ncbi:MAG TPA: hypothetical protein VIB78_13130 [Acidimicrobiia bacterium]|jgi:hypothetical protein